MTEKDFNSEKKCKTLLNNIYGNSFICSKCGNNDFYKGIDYNRICKKCKSNNSITKNTPFHNLRFGLVNGFNIAFECYNSTEKLSSTIISKKYKITQKTAWLFIEKLEKEKSLLESLFTQSKDLEELINNLKLYDLKKKND